MERLLRRLKINKTEILAFLVFFLTLFFLFPPFFKELPMSGHDFGAHMVHFRLFADALSQGQFPVRWVEWHQAGQSLPLFVYYQPFIYYFAELPNLLGLNLLDSMNISTLFLWIFSGITMFMFVRKITNNITAGLISASLYIFLPYHVLNIFIRSAYPESAALAFMPLLFYGIYAFFDKPSKFNFVIISISFFLITISHPVSFMIFALPVLAFIFFIYYINKQKIKNKTLLNIFLAFLLGIGLSAFYIFPAIQLQHAVNTSYLTGGVYDFRNHFLCFNQLIFSAWGTGNSIKGCGDNLSFQISTISIFILISSAIMLIYKKYRHQKNINIKLLGFFLLFSLFGIFLTLPPSKFIWDQIIYFSLIQFPWRFLGLTMFCISILGGIIYSMLNFRAKDILGIIFLILIPILSYQFLQPGWYLPKDFFAQDSTKFYEIKTLHQKKDIANMGYMPKTVKALIRPAEIPKSEIKVTPPNAKVETISNEFDRKIFFVNSQTRGNALLYIHYFPGWKFYVKGHEVASDHANQFGFPIISFPSGKSTITAVYQGTNLMNVADFITLISFIILIGIFIPKEKIRSSIKDFNIFSE